MNVYDVESFSFNIILTSNPSFLSTLSLNLPRNVLFFGVIVWLPGSSMAFVGCHIVSFGKTVVSRWEKIHRHQERRGHTK